MYSSSILENSKLDFGSTKNHHLYSDYSPDKYWTYERWWNQSGYSKEVFEAISSLPEHVLNDLVLTDVGSGKGQAIISIALDFNLKKYKGVEINPQYIQVCQNNIQQIINTNQQLSDKLLNIDIVESNIIDYKFDIEDNSLFLFNPVGKQTLKLMYQNLSDSLSKSPRNFYIIYRNANHRDIFLENGDFQSIYEHQEKKQKIFILYSGV